MDLKRFFSEELILGEKAYLRGREFYHATKVIRAKVGYKLIVCDGTPYDFYGTVTAIGKDFLEITVEKKIPNETEWNYQITLYIGVNKDLDTVTQKAVEMGVQRIVPFFSRHCNVSSVNSERMRTVILESSKQCGRSILAQFAEPVSFEEVLQSDPVNTFAFYEQERENTFSAQTLDFLHPINLVIGCEGGFSVEEAEAMRKKGFKVLTLGKRILRVSTAVVCACAMLNERLS